MSTITLPDFEPSDFFPPLDSSLLVLLSADPKTGEAHYAIAYSRDGGKTWTYPPREAFTIAEFNVAIPNSE